MRAVIVLAAHVGVVCESFSYMISVAGRKEEKAERTGVFLALRWASDIYHSTGVTFIMSLRTAVTECLAQGRDK